MSSGPDVNEAIMGSEGILGLVTEVGAASMYLFMCMGVSEVYVCVCVCVWEGEGEGGMLAGMCPHENLNFSVWY